MNQVLWVCSTLLEGGGELDHGVILLADELPADGAFDNRFKGIPLGFKTLISPAKEKVKQHRQQLAQIVRSHRAAPQSALIAHLNPVIRGWCRYYSTQASKRTFSDLSASLFAILQSWARRRHPKKNRRWVNYKYWHSLGDAEWVFAARSGQDRKQARPVLKTIFGGDSGDEFNPTANCQLEQTGPKNRDVDSHHPQSS